MAYATQVTISTGNKVSLNYQSQEVSVTLTYQLEREDTDVLAVVREKTAELAQAHRLAWQGLHEAKVSASPPVPIPPSPIETSINERPAEDKETATEAETTPGAATGDESSIPEARASHIPPDVWIEPVAPLQPATIGQRGALRVMLAQAGWSEQRITTHLRTEFDCEKLEELTGAQAAAWLLELQRTARQEAEQQRSHASRNGAKTTT